MLEMLRSSLSVYIPEVILVVLMCLLLVVESAQKDEKGSRLNVYVVALLGLGLSFIFACLQKGLPGTKAFYNAVVIDQFSTTAKMIMIFSTAGCLILAYHSKDIYSNLKSEYAIMTVGVLIGGMLLASANNLLSLYIGIETLSILSYVLSSFKREEGQSAEAGLKYVLYGGLTAGVMLFGMSHIYGITGTIHFQELVPKLIALSGSDVAFAFVSFMLFFTGLGYKVSCFPFHMWSPDVYQGSPIPVTAFFALVPKVAGLAVFVRVFHLFFQTNSSLAVVVIGLMQIIAALTMTVGNVSAIGQDSVKRILAFSSIGHVGLMLMGVVVMDQIGVAAILFYAVTYVFMTLVAFWVTSAVNDTYGIDSQSVFKGLIKRHPLMAICMSIALFSLAGLPPMSGFVAKFNIFSVLVEKGLVGLAFIAALNSVIGLYYYMKLIREMVFSEPESESEMLGFTLGQQAMIAVLTLPILLLGIFWNSLMKMSMASTLFLQ